MPTPIAVTIEYSVTFGDNNTEFTVYCRRLVTAMAVYNALTAKFPYVCIRDSLCKIVQLYDIT
jgi:hypothetical protein